MEFLLIANIYQNLIGKIFSLNSTATAGFMNFGV